MRIACVKTLLLLASLSQKRHGESALNSRKKDLNTTTNFKKLRRCEREEG